MGQCNTGNCYHDIPHSVVDERYVDGKDQLRKYPGHYVSVRQEGGATYHVTNPGLNGLPNAVLVAEGKVYKDGFDPASAPEYRNVRVIDFSNNREYIYDYGGDVRYVDLQGVA